MSKKSSALKVTLLQEPDFVSGSRAKKTLGLQIFFKKGYLSKFCVAKMKKTLVVMSQKFFVGYAFVNRKNKRLRQHCKSRPGT